MGMPLRENGLERRDALRLPLAPALVEHGAVMGFPQSAIERQRARGRIQRQLALDFIATHTAEQGWAPTVREVAAALDVSLSTAHHHLRGLVDEGRLVIGSGPRMLRVTGRFGGTIETK
jgi:hypothetical protein